MNLSSSRKTDEQLPREPQNSETLRVLLLGASGFTGSRILRALRLHHDAHVSILSRRHDTTVDACDNPVIYGDVTDASSLHEAVQGIDVVVNATSYVGSDATLIRQVNLEGTQNLLRACKLSSVNRIIHLGTASVYGSGPHRGPKPSELGYHPESTVSRARAAAEQEVLAEGGVVVRPNLVYGAADRWFVPGIVRMFSTLGGTIDHGSALLSIIDVESLGRLTAAVATSRSSVPSVLHAAHPTPIRVKDFLAMVSGQVAHLELPGDYTLVEALRRLEPAGFRHHQVRMLGEDHFYDSSELWNITGLHARPLHLTPKASAWYRDHMAQP
ncbi:NAD-dependent epimerase/dehydratase family protein [Paenarthrobacter nicotinovorans]|jgi:2-alkyl-3-oxoalkanoate reductase|uniref:NAD-dependent epimerase/dehydratase family protein n=1 Tax=Paenarthrobacter nicotinovorans TaxID=29320 RepID=UPI0037FA8061